MSESLITEEMVEVAQRQIELALQFVPNGQRLPDGNYRYGKNEIMNFHNECSRAAEKAIRAVAPMILEQAAKWLEREYGDEPDVPITDIVVEILALAVQAEEAT